MGKLKGLVIKWADCKTEICQIPNWYKPNSNELLLSAALTDANCLSPVQVGSCCESDKYPWLCREFLKIMRVNRSQRAGFTSHGLLHTLKAFQFSPAAKKPQKKNSTRSFEASANEGKLNPRSSRGTLRYYGNELERLRFSWNPVLAEPRGEKKSFPISLSIPIQSIPSLFSVFFSPATQYSMD